jgi:hypothetical protein
MRESGETMPSQMRRDDLMVDDQDLSFRFTLTTAGVVCRIPRFCANTVAPVGPKRASGDIGPASWSGRVRCLEIREGQSDDATHARPVGWAPMAARVA